MGRDRSRSRSRERRRSDHKRRHRSRSSSGRRKRHHDHDRSHSPRRSRRRSSSESSSRSPERRRRRRDKKKHRHREKEDKTVAGRAFHDQDYGKFGIIRESDRSKKTEEFRLWLQEVKKMDPERTGLAEERSMWSEYEEDYNTATLPHPKFYDLSKWQQ